MRSIYKEQKKKKRKERCTEQRKKTELRKLEAFKLIVNEHELRVQFTRN